MKRNPLALLLGLAASLASSSTVNPHDRGPRKRTPGLRRWKSIDRITRTKQHDQQAKLARRKERQANDAQLWQRPRAKWG